MESTYYHSQIFSKFGILSWILPYYGWFIHWKFLMKHVNKMSRNTWKSYTKEFEFISKQMTPLQKIKQNDGFSYFNTSTLMAIMN